MQALLQHVDQCMRHEDVVQKNMLAAQLARTLTEWHCNSFTDLTDEMELWDWNVANKDFWLRLAKSLYSQNVSVTWAEKMDQKAIQLDTGTVQGSALSSLLFDLFINVLLRLLDSTGISHCVRGVPIGIIKPLPTISPFTSAQRTMPILCLIL